MTSMRLFLSIPACALAAIGLGQSPLTVDQAFRLALERNGDIRAASLNADSAKEQTKQAYASFLPTLTPTYQYISQRRAFDTGFGKVFQQTEGGSTNAALAWRVLDSGERHFNFLSSRRSEDSSYYSAVQTLRQTLFAVYEDYIGALRNQESLKVSDAQVERSSKILEQTEARVKAGDAAGKDILQARADALNAQVDSLTTKQAVTTSLAALKGIIGWNASDPLPTLAPVPEPTEEDPPALDALFKQAILTRPDLRSARLNIESLRFIKLRRDRDAGPTFALDASWNQALTPASLENRSLLFTVSAPLFDGGLTRSQARQAKLNVMAAEATYVQMERTAKAEIESAYYQVVQNIQRLRAARAALEAAQLNYKAAVEAQRLGAENIIDVLTARVSLATAENNAISAKYDTLIAQVNLALVTGRAIPGAPAQ